MNVIYLWEKGGLISRLVRPTMPQELSLDVAADFIKFPVRSENVHSRESDYVNYWMCMRTIIFGCVLSIGCVCRMIIILTCDWWVHTQVHHSIHWLTRSVPEFPRCGTRTEVWPAYPQAPPQPLWHQPCACVWVRVWVRVWVVRVGMCVCVISDQIWCHLVWRTVQWVTHSKLPHTQI